MARCEVCGNAYDKAFEVRLAGVTHVFDSFECAIHPWRPLAATVDAESSGTGSRAAASSTVAQTAPPRPELPEPETVWTDSPAPATPAGS
jgi:hypothetical protein